MLGWAPRHVTADIDAFSVEEITGLVGERAGEPSIAAAGHLHEMFVERIASRRDDHVRRGAGRIAVDAERLVQHLVRGEQTDVDPVARPGAQLQRSHCQHLGLESTVDILDALRVDTRIERHQGSAGDDMRIADIHSLVTNAGSTHVPQRRIEVALDFLERQSPP